jgi:TrmH family RNA methyltransferase
VERISSRQNAIVGRFRKLAQSKHPDGEVLLDGAHLVHEALSARLPLEIVAFAESAADPDARRLVERAGKAGARTIAVTGPVLTAMSPVRNPSGVVAIGRVKWTSLDTVLRTAPQLVIVLHEAQDPGNVGAAIRAAEACGATGAITSARTANPFAWKALRGAMGSAFRLPIAAGASLDEIQKAASKAGVTLAATVPRGGTPLPSADLRKPMAILFGGEGAGLPDEVIQGADVRLTIPMRPDVESLNVAVSAAIILYEAARQRAGGVRT